MKNRPLISVIVPVYNVEKYLKQCLDSLTNQTYDNIEIICINDNSTDSSKIILNEYKLKYPNIKIINNQLNQGAGQSRNIGIKNSIGKYIHFVDSDDWLKPDTYEKIANVITQNKTLDLICFSYIEYKSKFKQRDVKNRMCQFDKILDISKDKNNLSDIHVAPWSKVVNKQLLTYNDIFFNKFECHEDFEYTLKLILYAKNVYFMNENFVYYRYRPNSLTSKRLKYMKYILDTTKLIDQLTLEASKCIRIPIMNYAYNNLIESYFDLYNTNYISYNELKNTLMSNIDVNIAFNKSNSKEFLRDRLKILMKTNNSIEMFFAYKFKYYVKKFLPFIFFSYIRIKKIILKKFYTKLAE